MFGMLISMARIFTPLLTHYRGDLEDYLSLKLGSQVIIEDLQASWYGLHPVIRVDNLKIQQAKNKKSIFLIKRLSISIHLWRSIWDQQLQPGLLFVDGVELKISRHKDTGLQLHGMNLLSADTSELMQASSQLKGVFQWFFNQSEVRIRNTKLEIETDNINLFVNLNRLKLVNDEKGHHFEGLAGLKNNPRSNIRIIGHLSGDKLQDFQGQYYLSIKKFSLPLLEELISPYKLKVVKGEADLQIWGKLQPKAKLSGQVVWRLKELLLQNTQTSIKKALTPFKGQLSFNKDNKGFTVKVINIEQTPMGIAREQTSLFINHTRHKTVLEASALDLNRLRNWLKFYHAGKLKKLLDLHIHGLFNKIQLVLDRHYQPAVFFGSFKQLGWHGERYLQANNIDGEIYLDRQQGFLSVDSKKASFAFALPYNMGLEFKKLSGTYRWKKMSNFWRIVSDDALFQTENLMLTQHFAFDWTGDFNDSYLNYRANINGYNIEELKPLLPEKGINSKLKQWLNMALVSVPKLDGHVRFKGKLGDFDIHDKNNGLNVNLHVYDADLKFHPAWPIAKKLDAQILIHQGDLVAKILQTSLGKNDIKDVNILIQPMVAHIQHLYLKASTQLQAQPTFQYVMQSPLKEKLKLLQKMSLKGEIGLDLGLIIPLYPEDNEVKFNGVLQLENDSFTIFERPLTQLQNLQGDLQFNEHGVHAPKLLASFNRQPLSFSIHKSKKDDQALQIAGQGEMEVSSLIASYPDIPLKDLEGDFSYRLNMKIPHEKTGVKIDFFTNLKNVASHLPSPFNKTKGKPRQLHIVTDIKDTRYYINFQLDKLLDGQFILNEQKRGLTLSKAGIGFGNYKSVLPARNGIKIIGNVNDTQVGNWQKWLQQHNNKDASIIISDNLPIDVSVLFQKLKFYNHQFINLKFNYQRLHKGSKILVDNKMIKGNFVIKDDYLKNGITINLEHLNIEPRKTKHTTPFKISEVPPITLNIKSLLYNNKKLGTLKMKAIKQKNAMVVKDFVLKSPSYELKLIGRWREHAGHDVSELEGYWQSHDLNKSLKEFDVEPVVEDKNAVIQFKLEAYKPMLDIELMDLFGDLSLNLSKGRITHLSKDVESKLGLGKLISILSLQTLPRRLVLDFSDLSQKGFSFDVLKGNFNLKNGILNTKNTYLDGAVAHVGMRGQLDIKRERYNLNLAVHPHITASLPVVATIAGGPVAGIATWFASKILNQGMQKVTGYTYQITGAWHDPIVQQVSISKTRSKK